MRNKVKKLSLRTETVRHLDDATLRRVIGGRATNEMPRYAVPYWAGRTDDSPDERDEYTKFDLTGGSACHQPYVPALVGPTS